MKEIDGFPGYFVTREGKVYSTHHSKGNKPKELKQRGGRYKAVTLTNGQKKQKSVHRLVAEAFILNPDNLPQVNHIDENKLNNHVDNLEWVTASQNQNHSNSKLYIIENKNGERFEVINLNKWCKSNNMYTSALRETIKRTRIEWYKGLRVVSIHELSQEERQQRLRGSN